MPIACLPGRLAAKHDVRLLERVLPRCVRRALRTGRRSWRAVRRRPGVPAARRVARDRRGFRHRSLDGPERVLRARAQPRFAGSPRVDPALRLVGPMRATASGGATCTLESEWECESARCELGTCRAHQSIGEPCEWPWDCATASCSSVEGRCTDGLLPLGADCDGGAAGCASDACYGGCTLPTCYEMGAGGYLTW